MDVQTSMSVNLAAIAKARGGPIKKKRSRDAGSVLARKRAQQFRKRDSNSRHLTGIINQAEKNRLTNREKLIDQNHKICEIQISRIKHQLRDELYEMQASKLALRRHSLGSMEAESDAERDNIEKYSQRGRYLYAIRNEVKVQKHIMESFNGRLEAANKLLPPARRQSDAAMESGVNMGSSSPTRYVKIGKRLNNKLPPLKEYADFSDSDDSEIERELAHLGRGKKPAVVVDDAHVDLKTPRPDFVKIRSELSPGLQMEIDKLEIPELTGLGIGQSSWQKPPIIDGSSAGSATVPPQSDTFLTSIDQVYHAQQGVTKTLVKGSKGRLNLPPVRAKGRPQNLVPKKLTLQTPAVTQDSRKLSTVCEH